MRQQSQYAYIRLHRYSQLIKSRTLITSFDFHHFACNADNASRLKSRASRLISCYIATLHICTPARSRAMRFIPLICRFLATIDWWWRDFADSMAKQFSGASYRLRACATFQALFREWWFVNTQSPFLPSFSPLIILICCHTSRQLPWLTAAFKPCRHFSRISFLANTLISR